MTKQTFKAWDTAYINNLPDSSFAYISSGGEKDSDGKTKPRSLRHLPYKDADGKVDLPHVRNALARLDQTQIPDGVKPGIKKKLEAILAKSKASEMMIVSPLHFDEDGDASVDASVAIPATIQLVPKGQWEHDMYGPMTINDSDIREFIQNFNQNIRKGVFITAGHEGFQELPAVGWVTKVEARDDGLWGDVEWNELGKETLSDKQFKFFSPEFYRDYEDPESHQIYRNVLTGGALTKSPYFKELQAVVFSDKSILKNNFNENNIMNLQELLAKDITTLTDEEKAFIVEHKEELTDEQKTSHTAIVDVEEEKAETEEEKTARETKEQEDANIASGLNADGTPKEETPEEKIAASEKVIITASELKALRAKADQGASAFAELEKKNISEVVGKMMYSETNKAGHFLPKSQEKVTAFMEKLTPALRLAFTALVSELPKTGLFSEKGVDEMKAGDAANPQMELENKIKAKQDANPKLTYSEALKAVMSENAEKGGLEQRYDESLPSAKKVTA